MGFLTSERAVPTLHLAGVDAGFARRTVLRGITLDARAGRVTALIGPSGCGKTTVLRCLNRLHELDTEGWVRGRVHLATADGHAVEDLYAPSTDVSRLRRRIGMVFQRPTPFVAATVFDNVAIGIRAHERTIARRDLEARVEESLTRAGLWREVADRLFASAASLSGGQQQRLCIARALAVNPQVLLLDEPTASLDPMATQRIEELLYDLRGSVTIVLVTHNLQQAARISDHTAVLLDGTIVEHAPTRELFTMPRDARSEAYITGRFG